MKEMFVRLKEQEESPNDTFLKYKDVQKADQRLTTIIIGTAILPIMIVSKFPFSKIG